MNIFCLSRSPAFAASWIDDSRISKMVTESAQMLANCFTIEQLKDAPKTKTGNCRKHSYYNHPCSKWVRESRVNFNWLIAHVFAMENERINKRGYNSSFVMPFIVWADDNAGSISFPQSRFTDFAIAISEDKECRKVDQFEHLDSITKYRLYFKLDKNCRWNKNPESKPYWYDYTVEEIINE